jgi:hypothetical protein
VIFTLEIDTNGPLLAFDLFGRPKTLAAGTKVSVPGDAVLELREMREQRSAELPTLLTLALSVPISVASGLVANWLYDKLKGRTRSLRIDHIEVQLDKGEIQKFLVDRLESKD